MCMANAYIEEDGQEMEFFKEAATLKINGDNLVLETLFGEEKTIRAEIEEIDFVNSKILLKKIDQ